MTPSFQSFYCYVEKRTGRKVVTAQEIAPTGDIQYFYVAACPNADIATKVYARYLDIARLSA